jgi:hypothetical protein
VRGETSADGSASITIEGESGTVEVLSLGGDETQNWTTASARIERFAGEEITLHVETEGEATYLEIQGINLRVTRDSDGDGLPNSMERAGIRNYKGEVVTTDPFDPDTDGDSLLDGDEVGYHRPGYQEGGYHFLNSNPAKEDSDEDGFTDFDEAQTLTNAMVADTDDDGIVDSQDSTPISGPSEPASYNKYYALAETGAQNVDGFKDGAFYGETGMPDGKYEQNTSDMPIYLVGWIGGSVVPYVELLTDGRDAIQNFFKEDYIEAILDIVSVLPFLIDDAPKTIKVIHQWVTVNPGKADDAFRLLYAVKFTSHIPASQIPDYYKAFSKWGNLKRLKGQAQEYSHYKSLKPFEITLQKNLQQISRVNIKKYLETGKSATVADVSRVGYDSTGKQAFLLHTGKWKKNKLPKVLSSGPGWRHITARHVHPESKHMDQFPDEASTRVHKSSETTLFPKDMTKGEIQDAIFETVENGKISDGKITYELNKHGIDEMTVFVDRDTGMIVTAFPESGPKVVRAENV